MLVRWALDKCDAEEYLAYVESTVEAVTFYEKLGFKIAGRIAMKLNESGQDGSRLYEEIGCIYNYGNDCTIKIFGSGSESRS